MSSLLNNKTLWGIILTFILGGLGSITGLVSPEVSGWITTIISVLTIVGHSTNVLKGVK